MVRRGIVAIEPSANFILALKRIADSRKENSLQAIQDELRSIREEVSRSEKEIRDEVRKGHETTTKTLMGNIGEFGKLLTTQAEGMRTTMDKRFQDLQQGTETRLEAIRETVTSQLTNGTKAINDLTQSNETRMEKVRTTVDERLQAMQTSNEEKLDQMRKTVDEKLQSTLEKRLGESFNQVSKRLEEVQRGLGEMQELATGVGDLKRVLTNVKTRGTWGEVQLGAILEEILTPDQYSLNVQVNEDSREEVEYAIRLPGSDDEPNSCVWLPIDSKFPLADYERLVQAAEAADKDEIEKATGTFLATVHNEAKTISEKYIAPPKTTDFAVMFLPTEGLYAEVLRAPGEVAHLMHRYRIVVAGPTTLAAILSSLRMGFRTLAIEKRSSEVWNILAAVKTEFGKFGDVMAKLKKQLNTASSTINQTQTRTRAMERQLQTVEQLPPDEASVRLGLTDGISAIQSTDGEESLD